MLLNRKYLFCQVTFVNLKFSSNKYVEFECTLACGELQSSKFRRRKKEDLLKYHRELNTQTYEHMHD